MKTVDKKILPNFFEDVKKGIKTFEVRKDEDNIQVGDILILKEWEADKYTGRELKKEVAYVLRDIPQYGLQEGHCIISLKDCNNGWIPCSERLPEKYGEYLCCDEYGEYIIGYPTARVSSDDYYVETEHEIMNNCIAWQPLPDPYIEK